MPGPTSAQPTRPPHAPQRQRGGRPARRRAPLTPLQVQVLAIGAAIVCALLYLALLRAGQDGSVRLDGDRIDVELREFTLKPQSVSIPTGNIEVYAANRGTQVHNLQIETIVPRSSDDKPKTLLAISAMQPGEVKSGNVTLEPGKYRWRSSIANDDDLGMYGVIEVRQQQ
ncbi:MAG: hypothetical protein QM679_03515 [Patulibacter sp.]